MSLDAPAVVVRLLAAVPFLPAGKGALILILGGFVTLLLALLLSPFAAGPSALAPPRRGPTRARAPDPPVLRPVPRADGAATMAVGVTRNGKEWVAGLERAVNAMHLGLGRIVSADGDRCLFLLKLCGSCLRGTKGRHGCERERASIQGAIRPRAPRAHVSETACNEDRNGACMFVIRRNGPA